MLRLLILFALLLSAPVTMADAPRPNVIFILCDDLGWGDLGVLHQNKIRGGKRHATPHLDAFAEQGIQLCQHYCPAPVCAPSRASLLLGRHQGHAEIRNSEFDKALPNSLTLGSVMQTAGYRTSLIGKYGLQGKGTSAADWPAYPTKRGFDDFFGLVRHSDGHVHYPANEWPLGNSEGHRTGKEVWHNDEEVSGGLDKCYTTDLFTAYAKKSIIEHRSQHRDQPFFIYLAYDTPHAALQLPTGAYPDGGGVDGGVQWLGEHGSMINTAAGTIDSWVHPDYRNSDWSDVEQRFATSVRRIDDAVGDVVQLLKDLEVDSETLVVFSSDNGPLSVSYIKDAPYAPTSFESYGPFDGLKRDVWEGGIRMPTLARWPSHIPAGRVDSSPSQFHDWMATFVELAGLAVPALADGVSLVPTLTGEGTQEEPVTYVEFKHGGKTPEYEDFHPSHRGRRRGEMQSLFLDGLKGVRTDIKSHGDDFEIYDVQQDPGEEHNLAGSSRRFDTLQQRMKDRVLQIRRPNAANPRPYDGQSVPAAEPTETSAGVHWQTALGDFPWAPKFSGVPLDGQGTAEGLRSAGKALRDSGAVQITGFIQVPREGSYTFTLAGAPNAVVRVHQAVLFEPGMFDSDGGSATSEMRLAAGLHPFRLTAVAESGGSLDLELRWSGPGIEESEVPLRRRPSID